MMKKSCKTVVKVAVVISVRKKKAMEHLDG